MTEATNTERVAVSDTWSLVLLTGGQGRRLGREKANVLIGSRTSAQRIVAQIPGAVQIIVVGSLPDGLDRDVDVVREEPPGGGPAAGVAAALPLITTELVAVLATDMPFAVPVLAALIDAYPAGADGVLAVDADGRMQYLCGVYRAGALRTALAGPMTDRAMRDVVGTLDLRSVRIEGELLDIDTPADLQRARDLAGLSRTEED